MRKLLSQTSLNTKSLSCVSDSACAILSREVDNPGGIEAESINKKTLLCIAAAKAKLRSGCSGVQIKTRKRNIAVALDPGSFANAVVVCFEDAREDTDLEKNLQSAVKVHTSPVLLALFSTHLQPPG